ncbi:MAG: hypothetical protein R3250_00140 [Melioribacteraceae bacterium]|nr:hypothetical protein [Melioribacteraceae bacterium]
MIKIKYTQIAEVPDSNFCKTDYEKCSRLRIPEGIARTPRCALFNSRLGKHLQKLPTCRDLYIQTIRQNKDDNTA